MQPKHLHAVRGARPKPAQRSRRRSRRAMQQASLPNELTDTTRYGTAPGQLWLRVLTARASRWQWLVPGRLQAGPNPLLIAGQWEHEEAPVRVATASLWQGGCQRPPSFWQSGRCRHTVVEVPQSGNQEALAGRCNINAQVMKVCARRTHCGTGRSQAKRSRRPGGAVPHLRTSHHIRAGWPDQGMRVLGQVRHPLQERLQGHDFRRLPVPAG